MQPIIYRTGPNIGNQSFFLIKVKMLYMISGVSCNWGMRLKGTVEALKHYLITPQQPASISDGC